MTKSLSEAKYNETMFDIDVLTYQHRFDDAIELCKKLLTSTQNEKDVEQLLEKIKDIKHKQLDEKNESR